jgi:hypothetical protein
MAMTPDQMLGLFRQQFERSKKGLEVARTSSNTHLAATNIRQGFKSCLMQGLIGWRCGLLSPVAPFRDAIGSIRQGMSILNEMDRSNNFTTNLPLEKAAFLEFLVNEPPLVFDLTGLVADRLLDAILGRGFQDHWDEDNWSAGLEQLRKLKGSSLAVETYITYQCSLRSSQGDDIKATVEKAISLFEKRRSNGFYSGGDQTDGGGNDNAVAVDYHLAAIMKKIDYKSDSIHSWKWG